MVQPHQQIRYTGYTTTLPSWDKILLFRVFCQNTALLSPVLTPGSGGRYGVWNGFFQKNRLEPVADQQKRNKYVLPDSLYNQPLWQTEHNPLVPGKPGNELGPLNRAPIVQERESEPVWGVFW